MSSIAHNKLLLIIMISLGTSLQVYNLYNGRPQGKGDTGIVDSNIQAHIHIKAWQTVQRRFERLQAGQAGNPA